MTRSLQGPLLAVLAAGALSSCGGNSGTNPQPPVTEDAQFPADYASTYTMVADARPSNPHPTCIIVYCSPASAAAYSGGNYPLAEGTTLVKEMHNDLVCATGITGYSTMKKLAAGTSPATGDWYWQQVDANFNVTASNDMGNVQTCVGCHVNCSVSDDWTCVDPTTRK